MWKILALYIALISANKLHAQSKFDTTQDNFIATARFLALADLVASDQNQYFEDDFLRNNIGNIVNNKLLTLPESLKKYDNYSINLFNPLQMDTLHFELNKKRAMGNEDKYFFFLKIYLSKNDTNTIFSFSNFILYSHYYLLVHFHNNIYRLSGFDKNETVSFLKSVYDMNIFSNVKENSLYNFGTHADDYIKVDEINLSELFIKEYALRKATRKFNRNGKENHSYIR